MKNRELIALLQSYGTELRVMTEGCDCWGDPSGVTYYPATSEADEFIVVNRAD